MMIKKIDRRRIEGLLEAEDIDDLPFDELERLFRDEPGIKDYLPDGLLATDPRSGDRVVFNSARARRPHDNRPSTNDDPSLEKTCIICQGRTTGIVDLAPLSEGFTFINKNLFPAFYPFNLWPEGKGEMDPANNGVAPGPSQGMHFLQWSSSLHDKDWHNMLLSDAMVVMKRLAALEKKLLLGSREHRPVTKQQITLQNGQQAYVLITKNFGRLVGGSLSHGHQQIALSNIMPKRFEDNWRFFQMSGLKFSNYLQQVNPPELLIKDYGPALLLVPYFMRRPYNMMLLLKDPDRQYIHQLNDLEVAAVAEGWGDAIRAIRQIMPEIGRELAYNVVTHNGPGAGLYFEFLPYTQEHGGFEQLGLIICQANPQDVAIYLRDTLAKLSS